MLGFGIGSAIDGSGEERQEVPKDLLGENQRGERVEVLCKDSTATVGRFERKGPLAADTYASMYDRFRTGLPAGIRMPRVGDTIHVVQETTSRWKNLRGRFRGIEPGILILDLPDREEPAMVKAGAVQQMTWEETLSVSGAQLDEILNRTDLPPRFALLIDVEGQLREIPLSDIAEVHLLAGKNTRWSLMFVGGVIDVVLIVISLNDLAWGD